MKRFYTLLHCGLLLMFCGSVFANSEQLSERSWKFVVYLDGTPIGYHRVQLNKQANETTVHTTASFDVRFLFIPVYSYEHETRETWENGCLSRISSNTDDNGDEYYIKGTVQDANNEFALETRDGKSSINGCIRSFAYWDVGLMHESRLLNTQTGEYQSTTLTDMGIGRLSMADELADGAQLDDSLVEARHFRLICEEMTIDLWYTRDMQWLALESRTSSGQLLRYLPETLPHMESSIRVGKEI